MKTAIRRSKYILTPTEFVKNDLIDFSNSKYSDKFIVTLEAGDPVNATPEKIKLLDKKKYLTFIGNAFPYKNIKRVIKAFSKIKKDYPDLHLALAGKKEFFYEQLEEYVLDNKIKDVHFLGFISDGEKRWLYQNAEAFVTASLSEGFCIPLLEAMYESCPVISSRASCLPEVAGEAAIYFDPHSTEDLIEKITSLLEDTNLKDDLIKRGLKRVKEFSWLRMADQTREVYHKTIKS